MPDVLIFSNNIDTYNPDIVKDAVDIIVRLVGEGKISEARIDEAYQRIMGTKNGMKNNKLVAE